MSMSDEMQTRRAALIALLFRLQNQCQDSNQSLLSLPSLQNKETEITNGYDENIILVGLWFTSEPSLSNRLCHEKALQ